MEKFAMEDLDLDKFDGEEEIQALSVLVGVVI